MVHVPAPKGSDKISRPTMEPHDNPLSRAAEEAEFREGVRSALKALFYAAKQRGMHNSKILSIISAEVQKMRDEIKRSGA